MSLVDLKIVIPTFNRSCFVKNLLSEIAQATIDPRVKIVVVDDFSCQEERNKLKKIEFQYKDVEFIFLPRNSGGGGARNAGAFMGEARWVWFLDDDDRVSVDTILGVVGSLEGLKEERLVFLSANFHTNGVVRHVTPQGGQLFSRQARYGSRVNTSCAIFAFELLKKVGGWDEKLVAGQDTDLFLRVAEITDAYVLGEFAVDVFHHTGTRITTNPRRQMKGKAQFMLKHYKRLHPFRLFRYLISYVLVYPYIRKYLGR